MIDIHSDFYQADMVKYAVFRTNVDIKLTNQYDIS